MDCHATARGSNPGGNGVLTELHVLRNGAVNGGAVSKWPRCRWDVKHNQPTNHDLVVSVSASNAAATVEGLRPGMITPKTLIKLVQTALLIGTQPLG